LENPNNSSTNTKEPTRTAKVSVSFFGSNEIGCVYDENTFAQICKSFKYIFVEHLEELALYVMKVKMWHW
jgi:hypothetical protein